MTEVKDNDWYCPECGFVMSSSEYYSARFDFYCPICATHTLSEFHKKEKKSHDKTID